MKKLFSCAFCASVLGLGIISSADAALVSQDWQTSGDQLLVSDTTSSLEWLKLTQTSGIAYGAVSGQLGAGGLYEGFRFANNAEVVGLFGQYFAIDLAGYFGERAAYLDPGARLASEALGTGISGGTDAYSGPNANYYLFGFTSDTRQNGSQFVLGAHTRWSDTDYASTKDPIGNYENLWLESYVVPLASSYLVRDRGVLVTPIPAALWLFGSGLAGMMGLARRRG